MQVFPGSKVHLATKTSTMTLSSVSTCLFSLAVVCILGFSDAAIPEGIYGDKAMQAAGSQIDPMGTTYWVQVKKPETTSGQCLQQVTIDGHKVADEIELSCNTFPMVSATQKEAIVGGEYYAESSTPATLYHVKDRTCVKYTYEHLPDTLNIDEFDVPDKDCRTVREKMYKLLAELAKKAAGDNSQLWTQHSQILDQMFGDLKPSQQSVTTSTNNNNNNVGNPVSSNVNNYLASPQTNKPYEVVISPVFQLTGNLVKNVAVEGPGIQDVITVSASEPTDVIKFKDGVVVGKILISKEPGKIVVITNNMCTQRTKDQNTGKLQTKLLSDVECQLVKKQIAEVRGEKAPKPVSPGNGFQNVAQNFGQTTNNFLGGVSQVAGQVIRPVNESIRMIFNYFRQIINMILNFIVKNFKTLSENNAIIRSMGSIASTILDLGNNLRSSQNGNQISGGAMNFGGNSNGGKRPNSFW